MTRAYWHDQVVQNRSGRTSIELFRTLHDSRPQRQGREQWLLYFARALLAAQREVWKENEGVSARIERKPRLEAALSERERTI